MIRWKLPDDVLNHTSNDALAVGCNFDTDAVDTYPVDPLNRGA
jgi:hypothetical protein